MSQPQIKPQTVARRSGRRPVSPETLQAPPVTASTRGMSTALGRWAWQWFSRQSEEAERESETSPQRERCQRGWERVDSSYEGEKLKVTKQIRVTRNVIEPLRKLIWKMSFFF